MSTESATPVSPGRSAVVKGVSLVGAAAVLTIVIIIAKATDHDSFAKGALIGGAYALVAMAFLLWRGSRGGAAARIASGSADERERRMFREASADAAIAMMFAAVGCAIWSLFDVEAIAVLAVVLWTGLLTWVISLGVRIRKG